MLADMRRGDYRVVLGINLNTHRIITPLLIECLNDILRILLAIEAGDDKVIILIELELLYIHRL